MPIQNAQFSTAFNYQKIAMDDSLTQNIGIGTTDVTILHNLGYIPSVRVWYDPALGKRFPISTWQITEDNSVGVRAYLTSTDLILTVTNPATSKDITFWYRIYYDS